MKTCTKCGREKPLGAFHRRKDSKDGRSPKCRSCVSEYDAKRYARDSDRLKALGAEWYANNKESARSYQLKRRYGITREEQDALFSNGCGVCGAFDRLHVDHDHKSGAVRGALCSNHNLGLGMFKDSIEDLLSAVEYLRGAA